MAVTNSKPCLAILAGLLLLVVGAPVLAIYESVASYREYTARIEQEKERAVRLRALVGQEKALRAKLAQVEEKGASAQFLQAKTAAIAAAELQEAVSTIIKNHGSDPISTRVLPTRDSGNLREIGIHVRFFADIAQTSRILYDLETRLPPRFVDSLLMRARNPAGQEKKGGATSLDVRLSVKAYQAGGQGT